MTFGLIRLLFTLGALSIGFQLGSAAHGYGSIEAFYGSMVGLAIAIVVIALEMGLGKLSLRGLSAAVFGLILALFVSKFVAGAIDLIPEMDPGLASIYKLVMVMVLSYLGMVFAMRGRDEFNLIIPYIKFDRMDQRDTLILLDTSVIIDGRILDVCQTKFIEGRFVVPRFVLKELQMVADSADPLKRNRGRRGLDVLNKLKRARNISIRIHEEDFPDIPAVDEKLIKLSRLLGGKVLTNDFNLNKLAELQGVSVLNLNELSNALKPMFLPGENLETRLVKEGKEPDQAIGYLEDGTMIVVDHAKRHLGQTVRLVVTSVLQTAAGRMIFARLDTENPIIGLEDA